MLAAAVASTTGRGGGAVDEGGGLGVGVAWPSFQVTGGGGGGRGVVRDALLAGDAGDVLLVRVEQGGAGAGRGSTASCVWQQHDYC